MDADLDGDGFQLSEFTIPCCNTSHTLNELRFDRPQGFARLSLEILNGNVGELTDEQRMEVESILGLPLKVIYQRI